MVNPLKRLNPQLSKLAAQVVYRKHRELAEQEVAELRQTLAQLIRMGRTSSELVKALLSASTDNLTTCHPAPAKELPEFPSPNAQARAREQGTFG